MVCEKHVALIVLKTYHNYNVIPLLKYKNEIQLFCFLLIFTIVSSNSVGQIEKLNGPNVAAGPLFARTLSRPNTLSVIASPFSHNAPSHCHPQDICAQDTGVMSIKIITARTSPQRNKVQTCPEKTYI